MTKPHKEWTDPARRYLGNEPILIKGSRLGWVLFALAMTQVLIGVILGLAIHERILLAAFWLWPLSAIYAGVWLGAHTPVLGDSLRVRVILTLLLIGVVGMTQLLLAAGILPLLLAWDILELPDLG